MIKLKRMIKKNKIKFKIKFLFMILLIYILIFSFFIFPCDKVYSKNNIDNDLDTNKQKEKIINEQKDTLNIKGFIDEANKYTSNTYDDINFNDVLKDVISGNLDNANWAKKIIGLFTKETTITIKKMMSIIVIILIHSVLKSITDGLENKSIGEITYYVQYILIVTLIMSNFTDIVEMVRESLQNLINFSNCLIPLLITLIISTGNIVSANIIQPILLFLITFIGNFINMVIIPIILISTILSIISKISDKIQLSKLSKFFKSSVVWILGVILTIFVGVLSIEGTLGSSVDGITSKTAKAAVSSFIPIVGKILGDAVDTVIGCTTILKNGVGIVGVIVIIGICILPIIKLVLLMITYYIGAAICEPIADSKIVNLLTGMGETFKVLLAILCSISMLLIISTTLVMKISNTGIMYR